MNRFDEKQLSSKLEQLNMEPDQAKSENASQKMTKTEENSHKV